METAQQDLEESRQYLENFWVPAVGSNVRFRHPVWDCPVLRISEIVPNYEAQVRLANKDQIAFVQDLEWVPDSLEIHSLMERMGIRFTDNGVQFGRVFGPIPTNYVEVAETLRTHRQVQLLTGGVDPYLAMMGLK